MHYNNNYAIVFKIMNKYKMILYSIALSLISLYQTSVANVIYKDIVPNKKNILTYRAPIHNYFLENDINYFYTVIPKKSLIEIKKLLLKKTSTLSKKKIEEILLILNCAHQNNINYRDIVTIIDYTQSSNKKRLWVFDLMNEKLLFHTYVSHGIKSGAIDSTYFSNINNSKASSIGVFKTGKAYRGRYGASLKLHGLDRGFNGNAYNRFIVMHGAWYLHDKFIQKYGRAGRSWGCPAVPLKHINPMINVIKEDTLLIAYNSDSKWIDRSKFLTCNLYSKVKNKKYTQVKKEKYNRKDVLFSTMNNKKLNPTIITVTADDYQRIFQHKAPLTRMLRRQSNQKEHVAITPIEITKLNEKNELDSIKFIRPEVKKIRGHYITELKNNYKSDN